MSTIDAASSPPGEPVSKTPATEPFGLEAWVRTSFLDD